MKSAVIAAIVAALVSSGATLAATRINGQVIAKHTIPANRLTKAAVTQFDTAATPSPRTLAAAVNSTIDTEITTAPIPDNDTHTAVAHCPSGDIAVGGGFSTTDAEVSVFADGLTSDAAGWSVTVLNRAALPSSTLTVSVSCEPLTP